ncbi:MAG: hypothetical protein ACJ76Q_01055 [Solirubrobacteraceae bacterium]
MAKTRIAVIALAAVALFAVPASAAKVQRCGPYSKNDGSLADGVVLNIKVVGMSCKTGQTVANGYHGVVGPFRAYGFKCLAQQAGNPPQQAGSVRCVKGPRRMSYANGPMNDCSTTPGILVPQSTATPISGPWTYNTDCATAVTVVNAGDGATSPVSPGWTCVDNAGSNNADVANPGGYCIMPTESSYDVVQWNDNVAPPGGGGLP